MKFENCSVYNFENALRGMRNPMNSWEKSDSKFGIGKLWEDDETISEVASIWAEDEGHEWGTESYDFAFKRYRELLYNNGILKKDLISGTFEYAYIGPKDMNLAKKLVAAGSEHRKFLRQIFVSIDITAPIYWWKEFDTYKVSTVANGTSTMHKLLANPITIDCFEKSDFNNLIYPEDMQRSELKYPVDPDVIQMVLIPYLEYLRQEAVILNKINPEEGKKYWKELVRWLPSGWLQTRTWTGNYENLRTMYGQRKNHKLTEWGQFCNFIETLPYATEFIVN